MYLSNNRLILFISVQTQSDCNIGFDCDFAWMSLFYIILS